MKYSKIIRVAIALLLTCSALQVNAYSAETNKKSTDSSSAKKQPQASAKKAPAENDKKTDDASKNTSDKNSNTQAGKSENNSKANKENNSKSNSSDSDAKKNTPPKKDPPAEEAEKLPEVKPEIKILLDKMEKAGEAFKTLKADIVYTVVSRLDGDKQIRTGFMAFAKSTEKSPDKFRISFDTLKLGEQTRKQKEKVDYIFDGNWLTIAKHKIKTITRLQIAAEGQKVEALRIGKGPFPVPFCQKTNDIIKYMEVSTRKSRKSDPENTYFLKLVPRKKYKENMNFKRLEIWVNKDTNLPVKIRMKDKNKNKAIVTFSDIKTDEKVSEDLFKMEKPKGWKSNVKPLK